MCSVLCAAGWSGTDSVFFKDRSFLNLGFAHCAFVSRWASWWRKKKKKNQDAKREQKEREREKTSAENGSRNALVSQHHQYQNRFVVVSLSLLCISACAAASVYLSLLLPIISKMMMTHQELFLFPFLLLGKVNASSLGLLSCSFHHLSLLPPPLPPPSHFAYADFFTTHWLLPPSLPLPLEDAVRIFPLALSHACLHKLQLALLLPLSLKKNLF